MKQVLLVEKCYYAIIHLMDSNDRHICDVIENNDMKFTISKAWHILFWIKQDNL